MNTLNIILLPSLMALGSVVVILIDAFASNPLRKSYNTTLLVLLIALTVSATLWTRNGSAFGGMVVSDTFSVLANFLFVLAALFTILLNSGTSNDTPQFHCLILLTLIGMMLLVSGTHLLVLFLALEILSLSVYVLASFAKRDPLSAESGLKYFLLGSFASAFFLYGMAFLYGATGSLQLNQMATKVAQGVMENRILLLLGLTFLVVGYAFKISLVPFHMWTPDVYEGAPTPVTAFMASTVKAAALGSMLRVFLVAFPGVRDFWLPLIWILAVLTMFVGNLAAIWQNNLKRLLAYSSIAHAGYMLIGLLAEPAPARQTILFYFAAYIFMNLGAFVVVSHLERTRGILTIPQYQGIGYIRPGLATALTFFLVSLGGLPPTAGFFAKFYLFRAVLESGAVWAVVLAVLNSAISFYYYLRVVISMFTPEKEGAPAAAIPAWGLHIFLVLVLTFLTLSLGLFPNIFLDFTTAVSFLT